jgi:uncharacterized RDD family membrane protein YckC
MSDLPTPPPPSTPALGVTVPAGTVLSSRAKRFGEFLLAVVLAIVTFGIGYLIWALIILGRGQTPEKQVLGMYVIDLDTGRTAGYGKMFLRWFVIDGILGQVTFGIFSIVSAFWIFSNPANQRLTDKMVNTIVVDAPGGVPG